jgi:SWI/SNF-related matrix-associated actin-dependent regulator of chromatin subfamily A3
MNPDEFHKKLVEKIVAVLNSGSDEECPICLEGLKTPVITHCAHLFCRTCIEQVINSEKVMNFNW